MVLICKKKKLFNMKGRITLFASKNHGGGVCTRLFRTFGDVTIADEELQNSSDQWSIFTGFERIGLWFFLSGLTCCVTSPRFFWSHPTDCPSLVSFQENWKVLWGHILTLWSFSQKLRSILFVRETNIVSAKKNCRKI